LLAGEALDQRAVEQRAAQRRQERRAGGDGEEIQVAQKGLALEQDYSWSKGSTVIASEAKQSRYRGGGRFASRYD